MRAVRISSIGAALVALTLVGCGGKKVQAVQPQMVATRGPLDFGKVPVLNAKKLAVDVENQGRAPLNVKGLQLDPASSATFTLEGELPKQIAAGEKKSVQVVFTPAAEQPEQGTLHLTTDDPNSPQVDIQLTGVGSTRAAIVVHAAGNPSQQSIDFGRIGEGKVAIAGVEIESRGTADLVIDGLAIDGAPDVSFLSSSKTPVTVASGQTLTLQLKFAPGDGAATPQTGTLTVHSTDPDHQTVQVPLSATVNRAPLPQIADPGPLAPGQVVQLDGSASTDPDGDDPIAFTDSEGGPGWTLVRTPINSQARVLPGDQARPQVTLDLPGQYVVRLVVTDATGLQTLHPAERTLIAKPAEALVVELVWDNPDTDLDLHFLPSGAQLGGAQDCWANDKQPDLGVPGDPSDDPILARDALDHFGPEEMTYATPVGGSYDVDVVFYSNHGSANPQTSATVRVYVYGEVVAEYTRAIPDQGHTWSAAKIDWPSGAVTKVDTLQ